MVGMGSGLTYGYLWATEFLEYVDSGGFEREVEVVIDGGVQVEEGVVGDDCGEG